MLKLLVAIGIVSVIVYTWSTIMIYSFLKEKDKKIERFIFIRLYIFRYINNYRIITKKETGKTGYLFYTCIISINLALLCFIVALIIKYL